MKKVLCIVVLFFLPAQLWAIDFPITFTDSSGTEITLSERPKRVVSLVPSITEMLLRLGVDSELKGITYHSVLPSTAAGKKIIGGFFNPDVDRVTALVPDLIFYADLHQDIIHRFPDSATRVQLSPHSIAETFAYIRLLGDIFQTQEKAREIIEEEQRQLDLVTRKIALLPPDKRLRIVRVMGSSPVLVPGDDSFQNEYIQAAGGIAPQFGRIGNSIPVQLEEWQRFNPQVIYGCGADLQSLRFLDEPGWRDVEAVQEHRLFFFPCDLTCRAATHGGYFVSWLAARVYGKAFGDENNFVLPEQVVAREALPLDLSYVSRAEIVESDIKDFRNKSVVLSFDRPMTVVSTLEGQKEGITTVANHYFPPPSWGLGHNQGLASLREETQKVLGFEPNATAMLFTGANIDNLAVVKKSFKEMEVTALVTAGVMGNAVRMGQDSGGFYEPDFPGKPKKPGTINIILLTNTQLTPRAMARGIISATEGKSAALQDMDIRSSYSFASSQATGTGTDNIIVVQGTGQPIDASGGHSKMGELMARAVYEGVQQAVRKQNGVVSRRPVFQRLKERHISLSALSRQYATGDTAYLLRREVEKLLLAPEYASFITALMAVSDDYQRGLVQDTAAIDLWCDSVASRIGGSAVTQQDIISDTIPVILAKGLGALFTGALQKVISK